VVIVATGTVKSSLGRKARARLENRGGRKGTEATAVVLV
jgi:hypothetical protein